MPPYEPDARATRLEAVVAQEFNVIITEWKKRCRGVGIVSLCVACCWSVERLRDAAAVVPINGRKRTDLQTGFPRHDWLGVLELWLVFGMDDALS